MNTHWPALSVCLLLALVGCTDSKASSDSGAISDPTEQRSAPTTGNAATDAPKMTELTPEMIQELGAAAWLPAGADFYLASSRLGEQLRALQKSRAFQSLWTIPMVRAAWNQSGRAPAALLRQVENDPQWAPILAFANDALSREVFVYCGEGTNDWRGLVSWCALEGLRWSVLGDLQGRPNAETDRQFADRVSERIRRLPTPVLVVGFAFEDGASASRWFEPIARFLGSDDETASLTVGQERTTIAEGEYLLLHVSGDQLGRKIYGQQQDGDGDPSTVVARSLLEGRTLTVAVGVRGPYLLFSIGPNSSHLERFGSPTSLAASEELEPIRRHFRPGVISLVHEKPLRSVSFEDLGPLPEQVGEVQLSAHHVETILKQLGDLESRSPQYRDPESRRAYLRVTVWDRGYEEFEFGWPGDGTASDRPLSILRHVGKDPLAVVASRSGALLEQYSALSTNVRALYGATRGLVLANLEEFDRGEFDGFEASFLPLFRELDAVLKKDFLPAFDGTESAWVVSVDPGRSELPVWGALPRPLRLPQVSLITEVRDRDAIVRGAERLRLAINRSFRTFVERYPFLDLIELQSPDSRAIEDGLVYSYSSPGLEQWGFRPHALLTDRHLVLSLSPTHSASLLSESDALPFAGADAPAIRATYFDHAQFWDVVSGDVTAMVLKMAEFGGVPREAPGLVTIHAPVIARALGAIRSYSSVTTIEDGREVRRSRLAMEDLPE